VVQIETSSAPIIRALICLNTRSALVIYAHECGLVVGHKSGGLVDSLAWVESLVYLSTSCHVHLRMKPPSQFVLECKHVPVAPFTVWSSPLPCKNVHELWHFTVSVIHNTCCYSQLTWLTKICVPQGICFMHPVSVILPDVPAYSVLHSCGIW